MTADQVQALLDPFCSKEDFRPALHHPFRCDGWIVATDGYCLLAVLSDLPGFDPDSADRPPNCRPLLSLPADIATCPLPEIPAVTGKWDDIDCPECEQECEACEGTGKVECESCGQETKCEACEGEGYIHQDGPCETCGGSRRVREFRPDPARLFGRRFRRADLDRLISVFGPGASVYLETQSDSSQTALLHFVDVWPNATMHGVMVAKRKEA